MRSAIVLAAALCAPLASAQAPYTVDTMLRLESIGKTLFDPQGRYLVFERHEPYGNMPRFNRDNVRGALRSRLYVSDLTQPGTPRPLFAQDAQAGFTLGSFCPSGRRISYRRVSMEGMFVGVYDLHTGARKEFQFPPDLGYGYADDPSWLSESRLVYLSTGTGRFHSFFSAHGENLDLLIAGWRQAQAGRISTASVIGAEQSASQLASESGGIVIADFDTGVARWLARGDFIYPLRLSPDGRRLAAMSVTAARPRPGLPLTHEALSIWDKGLTIYDLSGGQPGRKVCERRCDVYPGAFGWSSDSRALVFYARAPHELWSGATLWRYDSGHPSPQAVGLAGLRYSVDSVWQGRIFPRWQWLRGDLVAPLRDSQERVDWYLLRDGHAPKVITRDFGPAAVEVVGRSRNAVLAISEGKAWAVGRDGARRRLAAHVQSPVGVWQSDSLQPESDNGRLVMMEPREGSASREHRIFVLDADADIATELTATTAQAQLLDVSLAGRRAAFVESVRDVAALSVSSPQAGHRELVRINEFMQQVEVANPVRIDHRGPDGELLISWILMPPNAISGQPLPTVSVVYGGLGNSEQWTAWKPSSMHPLNPYVLTGRGYAVLFPSIPQLYHQVPRDPLVGLEKVVSSAVDAAIAAGYADARRLAIQGQSYGGYTTLGVIGQTKRFKAAVSMAGLYDLISLYGAYDAGTRVEPEIDLFGASLLETSQGGMGAPPWVDPQRYLNNSPLMLAGRMDTPVLLIHGDLDYIPISQAEEMFTALYRENKDAVLVRYWGEGHVFKSPANIRDMWERIFAWYDGKLGPAAAGNELPLPQR